MSPQQLIQSAYDPELLRRCASTMAALLSDHLSSVWSGARGVQDWVRPELNVERARQFLHGGGTESLDEQFQELVRNSLLRGQHLHHRRYAGHQVPAALPLAGLFDAVISVTNQVQGVYEMGPWGVSVERAMIDTIGRAIGLGNGFGGIVTAGGTLANLTALLAARAIRFPNAWQRGVDHRAVLVAHGDSHYCVDRAAGVMGIGTDRVIRVPVDQNRRMSPTALDQVLSDLRPRDTPVIAVVAASGTTAVGAFDPITEIAQVCREHEVWLHVDAAHGGGVGLSRRYRHLIAGVDEADSVVVDAHKMMFMPAVCAFVFYKHAAHRFQPFQQIAPYLFDPSAPELAEYDNGPATMECTKRAGTLGLWGLWSMFGPELFESMIDQVFATAAEFYCLLDEDRSFEVVQRPQCNIVVYRYRPADHSEREAEVDELQYRIRRRLLDNGQAYLTQTKIDDRVYLRSAFMNPLTGREDLQEIIAMIKACGQACQ